jgi:dihydropyrimidinase
MAIADFDLVIRNGTVATDTEVVRADVGVRDGRVAALAPGLPRGRDEMDATGRLVLPGGVDSHVHLAQQSPTGASHADDFRSGTTSAACGGTTTVIPFATQFRGQSLRAVVDDYHRTAENDAVIDYAFHLLISDVTDTLLHEELPALIPEGYTSFKVFMTYEGFRLTDRQLLEVLAVGREQGALVMIHAENHDIIEWLSARLLEAKLTAPKYHAVAKPMVAEREASHRAIALAEVVDVPILIVHVSAREAIEQIRWARERGLRVYAETCPQYLFLTEADLDRPGLEGAKFMCSPPHRDRANQEMVWRALQDGVFDVFSSDHAPYRFDDPRGKKFHGEDAPFTKIPNGVPGVEVRVPLLFSEGVGKGRIDLKTFVSLTASQAARLYGLYPRKGTLAVGSDADIAIWDPEREVRISREILHDNLDYTPYEGIAVRGWPVVTLSRGEVVWNDGKVLGRPGRGRFLPCDRSAMAQPLGGGSDVMQIIRPAPRY